MLALLLAAQLSAPVAQEPPAGHFRVYRALPAQACKGHARYQTSGPEPALLLRPQDRIGPKTLAEMPMGEKCLVKPEAKR